MAQAGYCSLCRVLVFYFCSLIEFCIQIDWPNINTSILNSYRQLHRLQVPSAFDSILKERILRRTSVSRRSPTMMRHRAHRKVSKEQLALAVKKDFNDAMVNELESISTFLYSIHNKGICPFLPCYQCANSWAQDKSFRMHFTP